ncbi:hypothetical protein M569_13556, partial [Genlisea aurea]
VGLDSMKMVVVGLIWGATNALMRRGTIAWDRASKSSASETKASRIRKWMGPLLIWQYSLPLIVNLSASAAFFAVLREAPISTAVPVTNASTFAATAVFGILLGEKTRSGMALLGTLLILLGVYI